MDRRERVVLGFHEEQLISDFVVFEIVRFIAVAVDITVVKKKNQKSHTFVISSMRSKASKGNKTETKNHSQIKNKS
jgi:hypothetical protein